MRFIQKQNHQYRVSGGLLTLFTAPFIVWQMGVLYYSGTTMSLFGRTPIPLTRTDTLAVIVIGYLASILFISLFPRQTVRAERVLMPAVFLAAVLIPLPFPSAVITVLFYIEAFVCTFSIGVMVSVTAHQFTTETAWRDGIIGMAAGGVLIAILQNELYPIRFTVFTLFSIVPIALITVFYYLIPAKIEAPYVQRKDMLRMPKVLFLGLWAINSFSTLLLCFASSFAESVPNGISVLYLSAAVMAMVLTIIRRKLKARSLRIYGGFFALSVLGFVLSYLSLRIPFLRYPSLVLLGFIVVLAVLWTFFAAVSFGIYPTRFIGAIGAGMGLTLALFHSSLQELLRDNIALLYGIYAALSVVLLIVYFFLEPYFVYAWNKKDAPENKAVISQPDRPEIPIKQPHPFDCLSEQEYILARLILDGHTESSAAKTMNITLNTEKGYRKSLYFKLDIHSKRELFDIANRNG